MTDTETENVYLERIELSNFRAYGDSFTLPVPPGPGITLISGPNGLGKTTLFDGIEWCLTGRASRFEPYLPTAISRRPNFLTRDGAKTNSHRVSLYFTGAEPFDRGLGLQPDQSRLMRTLKRGGWPEVSDLGRYLSITHFLGQSASQRFSVKKPKDQWEALKGPAGVDRVNRISERLGGQATRRAFTRHLEQAAAALAEAQRLLAEWDQLTQRVERLRTLAQSGEAVSPAEAFDLCNAALFTLGGELGDKEVVEFAPLDSPETAFQRVRAALDRARVAIDVQRNRAERLHALASELQMIRGELRTATELGTGAESRRVDAEAELARTAADLDRMSSELTRSRGASVDAEAALQLAGRLVEAVQVLGQASDRQGALENEVRQCEAALNANSQRLAELSERMQAVRQLEAQRRTLADRLNRMRSSLPVIGELEEVRRTLAARAAEVPSEDVFRELRARRESLQQQERDAQAEGSSLQARLAELEQRVGAITALAARLSSMLSEDDLDCPVCATSFERGQLVQLARGQRTLTAVDVRELAEALAANRIATQDLTSAITQLDQEESAMLTRLRDHAQLLNRRTALEDQIADLVGGRQISTAEGLASAITNLEFEAESLDASAQGSESLETLQGEVVALQVEQQGDSARLTRLRAEAAEMVNSEQRAQALLSQYPEVWSASTGLVRPLEEVQLEAAARVASTATELDALAREVSKLREQLEEQRRSAAEVAELRASYLRQQEECRAREEKLLDDWVSLGLAGEPNVEFAWRENEQAEKFTALVAEVNARVQRASAGYRVWSENNDLGEAERILGESMRAAGVSSPAEMRESLVEAVRAAEQNISRATRARETMNAVVTRLQEEADRFAESVLEPLNETIYAFSQALLTRADGSLFYRAEYHANRSELHASIRRSNQGKEVELVDRNPNLFFSEGQLSALSVSALLAASTKFRWSRWPALLMDDPLQHNDVIHASAFIDIMCRLVSDLEYQVILSTHDTGEAAYIARKCQGAGVAFHVCELSVRGEGGLTSVT
jgi:exonuclease SbcC